MKTKTFPKEYPFMKTKTFPKEFPYMKTKTFPKEFPFMKTKTFPQRIPLHENEDLPQRIRLHSVPPSDEIPKPLKPVCGKGMIAPVAGSLHVVGFGAVHSLFLIHIQLGLVLYM